MLTANKSSKSPSKKSQGPIASDLELAVRVDAYVRNAVHYLNTRRDDIDPHIVAELEYWLDSISAKCRPHLAAWHRE